MKNYGDVIAEYEALRNGAIIYDGGTYGVFSVQGENASDFLEQLSTKDISNSLCWKYIKLIFRGKRKNSAI